MNINEMGNKQTVFDPELLLAYQECTFFTEKQIRYIYKRFSALNPEKINPRIADTVTRLTFTEVQQLIELRVNPFKQRICEVFSTDNDGMSFEDFLDMCSAFSDYAPWELKSAYAFRIFDFDSDSFIGRTDIEKVINCITGNGLTEEEISAIVDYTIKEVDLNEDNRLSYAEFEHILTRAPDFTNTFKITI